jgi:digeranylgeranylglycerophospholipid reductase
LEPPQTKIRKTRAAIVGGSIAGLLAAREICSAGVDAVVLEEHREIGVPEKCDGLVSSAGLAELGVVPPADAVQNTLFRAEFYSPSMKQVSIDARKQNVIVLDRSRFDKYLAERAAASGANFLVGSRVTNLEQGKESVTLSADSWQLVSDYVLDCSGSEAYIRSGGRTVQGAQFLVYGKWFEKGTVEVYLDPVISPGFFTWVIPISEEVAKIGIGGEGINTFAALDRFAESKGAKVIRKMAAPIVCYGPARSFIEGRMVRAGDAAGQAKPTTGGGIFTGGFGGMLAGRALAKSITVSSQVPLFEDYENVWRERFGKEFSVQLRARSLISKLSRDQVDKLFDIVSSSELPRMISEEGDFDRHSLAIARLVGFSKLASILGIVITNEMKSIFGLSATPLRETRQEI